MCTNAVDKKSTFLGVFKNKRALVLAAVEALNRRHQKPNHSQRQNDAAAREDLLDVSDFEPKLD